MSRMMESRAFKITTWAGDVYQANLIRELRATAVKFPRESLAYRKGDIQVGAPYVREITPILNRHITESIEILRNKYESACAAVGVEPIVFTDAAFPVRIEDDGTFTATQLVAIDLFNTMWEL